jgi:hypothetical protein
MLLLINLNFVVPAGPAFNEKNISLPSNAIQCAKKRNPYHFKMSLKAIAWLSKSF